MSHGKTVKEYLLDAATIKEDTVCPATILSPTQKTIDLVYELAGILRSQDLRVYRLTAITGVDAQGKTAENGAYRASLYSMLPISPNLRFFDRESTALHAEIACANNNAVGPRASICLKEAAQTKGKHKINFLMGVSPLTYKLDDQIINYASQEDPFYSTPMMLLVRTLQSGKLMELLKEALDACEKGYFDLANLKLHLQDRDGRTVLHYAYALGQTKLVDTLLAINEKLPPAHKFTDIKDNNNQAPLELLTTLNEKELRQILVNLEMHPDRSTIAEGNALTYDNGKITLEIQGVKFLLLANKSFLEGLKQCLDYEKEVPKELKKSVEDFITLCSKRLHNPDQTIGHRCLRGVALLREKHKLSEQEVPIEEVVGASSASTERLPPTALVLEKAAAIAPTQENANSK